MLQTWVDLNRQKYRAQDKTDDLVRSVRISKQSQEVWRKARAVYHRVSACIRPFERPVSVYQRVSAVRIYACAHAARKIAPHKLRVSLFRLFVHLYEQCQHIETAHDNPNLSRRGETGHLCLSFLCEIAIPFLMSTGSWLW